METSEWFRFFAERDAGERSPLYRTLANGVADDPEMISWIEELPEHKRQPNLLLAAVNRLGGIDASYDAFRAFVFDHAAQVRQIQESRSTQTNEVGRCATLLTALARIPGPFALLEVGTSAGLCLLPDRYGYDYGGRRLGDPYSPCQIHCTVRGPAPIPEELPEIVWRAGIDLHPLDVREAEDVAWLEACVWPDQPHRLAQLRAAIRVAREDPPRIVEGDLLGRAVEIAREAPSYATLVIYHSAVLAYLPPEGRARFAEIVASMPRAVWVSQEGPGVLRDYHAPVPEIEPLGAGHFVLARDRRPLALVGGHGEWIAWPERAAD